MLLVRTGSLTAWTGDYVHVMRKGVTVPEQMMLGEYIGNTGPQDQSWRDCKDLFRPFPDDGTPLQIPPRPDAASRLRRGGGSL